MSDNSGEEKPKEPFGTRARTASGQPGKKFFISHINSYTGRCRPMTIILKFFYLADALMRNLKTSTLSEIFFCNLPLILFQELLKQATYEIFIMAKTTSTQCNLQLCLKISKRSSKWREQETSEIPFSRALFQSDVKKFHHLRFDDQ